MKKRYKIIGQAAVAVVLSASVLNVKAQSDAAAIIKAGTADANNLMTAYAGPLMKSFGAGLNSGWFQTAKPHGLGGFDITVSANLIFIPSADQNYNVNQLGLQKVRLKAGEPNTAPTVFGSDKNGPTVEVYDKSPLTGQDTAITSFSLPPGIGVSLSAVPTAQLAVGVGFGTEVAIRFIPSQKVSDASVSLIGFAVKHDFKQWIPVLKDLPFDMSAMFGYTSMSADVKFNGSNAITPEKDANGNDISYIYYGDASNNYSDQKMEFKSKAWTTNLLVSKKLGPFTPYLGLGYQKANTDLSLLGIYPVTVPNDQASATNPLDPSFGKVARIHDVKDPVNISGNISGMRTTIGFRLKFAIVTLHADYTFAQYNVAAIGLGLNLQSIAPFKM